MRLCLRDQKNSWRPSDEALSRWLFNLFDRFGWRQPPYQEPFSSKGVEPKRFERLTFRALAEAAISESKAAELLGMSVRELNRRMAEPPAVEHAVAVN